MGIIKFEHKCFIFDGVLIEIFMRFFLAHLSRSFSHQELSVVCRRYRKPYTFSPSSPDPLGQFQLDLAQNITG